MLTIKAIYAPNQEEIFEAQSVKTVPVDGGPHVNVIFTKADGLSEMAIFTKDCYVYVMNDKGRTIANYS